VRDIKPSRSNAAMATPYPSDGGDANTLQRGRRSCRRPRASLQQTVNAPSATQTQLL